MSNNNNPLFNTARTTGFWYLILAVSGISGFMIVHPQVFIANDPQMTLTNLINHEGLARTRLLLEFVIVISQALTAVWFYKLFRSVNEWAAWTLGIWGMVNSAAIMISAISMSSAISIAQSAMEPVNQVMLTELLTGLGSNAWGVGSIFFGLWLIPMGYIIISSKRMPVWLGWTLIIGSIGYLSSTFLNYSGFETSFTRLLTVPATIGEFWMIGYLLIYGIRPATD
ncbi:DUF4386 domain-containing protein [Rhodohalobacter mucosus]|uniref:DUF4386 domain-containing protein n=1 Tax=Rhodohalobacter mucosus TaxID=2079485 RepID=A0A316TSJ5_9BACT|nr:DUF4386 domain-containing protein [Rhodohalobacter mucosus]PWN07380.1 DUF4386 domain-containing protein [Rhodohalobacter mucosus]